jgi:pimeloyl-ACP methyl ester carboxylesterase
MIAFPYRLESKALDEQTRATAPGAFVGLSDGITHYELAGPGDGETVVLVHGFSVPYFIWETSFQYLKTQGYRVLRYDLFGRGYSDRPLIKNDVDLFVRQLDELADALSLGKPFNVFGLSMGGVIAAHYTARFPQTVRRLGLFDPAGFPFPYGLVSRLVQVPYLGEMVFNWLPAAWLTDTLAADFCDERLVPPFVAQYLPQMELRGFRASILSTMRSGMLENGSGIYQRVGGLDMPVLLVWGEGDTTVPFKHSAEVRAAIPRAQFHAIPDSKHIPHYEQADIVNPIIRNFLSAGGGGR